MTFFMFDKTRKKAKIYYSLDRLPFHSTLCVFNNHLGRKKSSYKIHSHCQNIFWTLIFPFLMFVGTDDPKKSGSKTFVIKKTAVSWNVCFYRSLRSQRNVFFQLHKNCQKTLQTLINGLLTLFVFDKARTNGPKWFFRWKVCLFFQNFLFSTNSWS